MVGRMLMLGFVLMLSGCVTSALYESDGKRYVEPINQVMVSADGEWFVVLGVQHHYVFPMPEELQRTFESGFYPQVRATFGGFKVNNFNRISGRYRLWLKPEANEAQRAAALEAGYQLEGRTVLYEGEVSGKRYSAEGFDAPEAIHTQALNGSYSITVTEALSPGVVAMRTAATPLAVLADGAVVLAAIPLVVIVGADIAINGMPSLHSP